MAVGHEQCTAFRTKFGLYEYMFMLFRLTNAPGTFPSQINRILRPLLGIKLVINTKQHIHKDNALVVVAYINDILIAMKGSIKKHHRQVGRVFDWSLEKYYLCGNQSMLFGANGSRIPRIYRPQTVTENQFSESIGHSRLAASKELEGSSAIARIMKLL